MGSRPSVSAEWQIMFMRLLSLSTSIAISKAIQLIKGGSSVWIHQTFPTLRNFSWQQGYGAFSVGISQMPETIRYIEHQAEHHRTRTFQEEYLSILKKHEVTFDEKYLWGVIPNTPCPTGRIVSETNSWQ
jgi:putative transposase